MEKSVFDIMARIAVVGHADKVPPDFDFALVNDEARSTFAKT
jgi:hypothetical protein